METTKDEEERRLEAEVFGELGIDIAQHLDAVNESNYLDGAVQNDRESGDNDNDDATVSDGLFVIDRKKMQSFEDKEPIVKSSEAEADEETELTSAWHDDDDEGVVVAVQQQKRLKKLRKEAEENDLTGSELENRLREKHKEIYGERTKWAEKINKRITDSLIKKQKTLKRPRTETDDLSESESELFRSSASFVIPSRQTGGKGGSVRISPGRLEMTRLNDANQHGKSKSVVQSIDWHRNAMLFLTAGFDKTLRIFQVDGKQNPKVHSVYFKDLPIREARFIGDNDEEIICVGRRKFMYWVDLETNKIGRVHSLVGREEKSLETMAASPDGRMIGIAGYDGNVLLVSQKTKHLVGTLKMNGNCRCMAFSNDGLKLYSSGTSGQIYIWDLRMNRCLHRHTDEGSTGTRAIAITADGSRYATGSEAGVVNIYETQTVQQQRHPTPLKSVFNLTTPIDQLTFNYDGQLLSMISRRKRDAMKLLNCNNLNVVTNWPTSGTPLKYAQCAAFSPNGGMLSIANDKGKCLLYRVLHYETA